MIYDLLFSFLFSAIALYLVTTFYFFQIVKAPRSAKRKGVRVGSCVLLSVTFLHISGGTEHPDDPAFVL